MHITEGDVKPLERPPGCLRQEQGPETPPGERLTRIHGTDEESRPACHLSRASLIPSPASPVPIPAPFATRHSPRDPMPSPCGPEPATPSWALRDLRAVGRPLGLETQLGLVLLMRGLSKGAVTKQREGDGRRDRRPTAPLRANHRPCAFARRRHHLSGRGCESLIRDLRLRGTGYRAGSSACAVCSRGPPSH